jgi:hypothetical protein
MTGLELINEKEDWNLQVDGHVTCCAPINIYRELLNQQLIEMTPREIDHHRHRQSHKVTK